tara:strand:+ start:782 stop:1393 length:612 start_codon:yes stop_codon:yes gene_type:complete
MKKSDFRINFLVQFFFIYLIFTSIASTENNNINSVVLGEDNAPVKIKVFSSLTCPHCASFHKDVVPEIKKKYIDAGKVQIIFIDFPLDKIAFNASKLLHCLERNKQISFLDTIYDKQNQWTTGSNSEEINNNLKKLVETFGMNSKTFDKCLNNEIIAEKILNGRIDGQQKYSIDSTPTIIINEKKFKGDRNFKNIKKKIEKLI